MLSCLGIDADPLHGRYAGLLGRVTGGVSGPTSLVLTGPGVRLEYGLLDW